MVRGASFISIFNIDEIAHIGWFRFVEIMSNVYDFVLYALFYLQPVKRFECRSGMRVLSLLLMIKSKLAFGTNTVHNFTKSRLNMNSD